MNSGEEGRVPEKRKVPGTVPEMVLASVREFPPDHPVQASAHFPCLPEKVSVHLIRAHLTQDHLIRVHQIQVLLTADLRIPVHQRFLSRLLMPEALSGVSFPDPPALGVGSKVTQPKPLK